MTYSSISAQELQTRLQADPMLRLIDVRTPVEYRQVHVQQAENIPLDQLNPQLLTNARGPVYVLCQSGMRARNACDQLSQANVSVIHIEGGTLACIEAQLPVVRGMKAVSLERQVRMVAGTLVLIGAILAWFVHPAWIGLSAFIGAGLLVAGLTDTCGMAMILARMPWNQVKPATTTKPKLA